MPRKKMPSAAHRVAEEKDERDAVLERIWLAQAKAYASILEKTAPEDLQAAMLTSARQFLADQGVNRDSLDRPARGQASIIAMELALERLHEDDDDGGDPGKHPSGNAEGDRQDLPPLPPADLGGDRA